MKQKGGYIHVLRQQHVLVHVVNEDFPDRLYESHQTNELFEVSMG